MTTLFQFNGDHTAVEEWAEQVAADHSNPERGAMFMGDYRGVYIDPDRAAEHGIRSRYRKPILVKSGDWMEWTGREFVRLSTTRR